MKYSCKNPEWGLCDLVLIILITDHGSWESDVEFEITRTLSGP